MKTMSAIEIANRFLFINQCATASHTFGFNYGTICIYYHGAFQLKYNRNNGERICVIFWKTYGC